MPYGVLRMRMMDVRSESIPLLYFLQQLPFLLAHVLVSTI